MGSARVFHPRRVEPPDRWRWGSRWWPELCRHSRQSNEWRLPMQNNNHQRRPCGTNLEQGRYWSESFHGRRTYRDVLLAERSCETRRNNERVQQRQISPAHIQGEGSKSASLRYQFRRSQSQGNNQQRLNLLPGSFSIFVDGLGDRITHAKLRAIFAKAGRLREVFIQQKKKPHRRFRFGFVRFTCDDEARAAIRKFNGLRLEGNYLVVQKARFQRTFQTDRVPPPGKHQYEIRG
ncbi:uncharacterized protein LOC130710776 [Lotus japonicus]|uniref:uncharacterized protein LOC130710776 n=1 Tax=Lotus japonicus TaxID=34305 RepID=UPI00258AA38C|nr:uncharacterized protein LOC130710776 [Lotus japonicus]